MASRRRRRELPPDDELDDELEDELDEELDDEDDRPSRPRRRRRNWRLRFLIFLLLVAALAAGAPTIVAKTPLRNLLLGRAVAGASAQLAARDASFSWTGAQGLAGVTVVDAQGAPLATVELISVDRSLVGLAADSRTLGKISILRPVLHLETRDGGSNFEDLISSLAEVASRRQPTAGSSGGGPVTAEIEIVDGVVLGRDASTGQEWRIDELAAAARTRPDGSLGELTGAGVLTLTNGQAAAPPMASRVVPDPGELQPGATIPPDAPGHFKFRLSPSEPDPADADKPRPLEQRLELIADRLPLAPLEPWLARILPAARITGFTSADLKLAWTAPPLKAAGSAGGQSSELASADEPSTGRAGAAQLPHITAAGRLDASDLRFTAAALEGDLVELTTAALAVDAALADGQLSARQLKARCPWLEAEAAGDFNLTQLTGDNWRELPATDSQLTARIDLPQLARMLPRTLRLRPGVKIDSGNIEITARSAKTKDNQAARRWTVAASIDDLLGSDGKRAIRWTQPVEAGFDAAETPLGPQLTRVIFRAPFAAATAEAVDEGYRGQLEFNLDQLADQLGQFVDLSQWKLAGAGKGDFTLRNTGDDRFVAVAKMNLKDIDVRTGGRVVWLDPELAVELNANGRRLGLKPERLETATAVMRSPQDSLEAELLEPVDIQSPRREFAVRIKGDGPLGSWAGRLRPWVAGVPEELSGASTVNAELRAGPGLIQVVNSNIKVRDLRTRLGGAELIEPRLEAGGDFRWSDADRSLESKDFQLASSTVAARIGNLSLRLADAGPPTVRGNIAFRGDLERLAAWAGLTGPGASAWPQGHAVGRVELASDAQRATAAVTMTAEPFTLVRAATAGAPQPAVAWHEPKLQLSASANYANADDRLDLADIRVEGQTIQLTGRGAVEQLRTAGLVRGDVNVTYDAAEFARLLAGYLGPGVTITGANAARLQYAGRLHSPPSQGGAREGTANATLPSHVLTSDTHSHWSRRWQVTAESGWSAANLYGLPIGAAKLAANLQDGRLNFTPLDLAVGQGRVTLAPRTQLDPPPQQLTLPPGPLVSNVAISREVSDAMLKYAAPMLANATRTDGSFSVFLDSGLEVPLGNPQKAEAEGRVTIHRLAILPGPMLQDVINLISRVEAISKRRPEGLLGALVEPPADRAAGAKGVTMTERTIDVKIVEGRVYHRNLEFLVDDVPVRSRGSVGFDQTLALEIEVPIQAKWVGSERALQPLIGQVIRIPVSGTFTRWKIDERAIGQFLGQAAQTAVGGALEGELNKALDKLFKPR